MQTVFTRSRENMELPKRKPTRLKGYDYSTPGAYFVTVCTYNKQCILSDIVVGEGFNALPQNKLTPIGSEVEKAIQYINNNYDRICIDKYIIMPNHIHLIVILNDSEGHGSPPLPSLIGRLKSYTTQKYGKILWQRSFHDHVVRNQDDYLKIWEYIDTNTLKWRSDCFFTE